MFVSRGACTGERGWRKYLQQEVALVLPCRESLTVCTDVSYTVVQSESSDGEKWSNLDDLVIRDNWCVPGDFRCELFFRLYRMSMYTTKNQGMIENKSIKKNQMHLVAIRKC